jgi:hypothetical protein
MSAQVPDDVLSIFAASGTYAEIAQAIEMRFGGMADSVTVDFPSDAPTALLRELLADIHRIPHQFVGFETIWTS